MAQQDRNWKIGPFTMWRIVWRDTFLGTTTRESPHDRQRFDGASIEDRNAGLIYEAVVERAHGRAHLTGITILTTRPGQRIDQNTIRRIPVQRIAEQVSLQLEAEGPSRTISYARGPRALKSNSPSVEEVADDYKAGLSRKAIAARRHASVYTVDKRLREARDRKLIAPPTTGRPRRPETPGPGEPTDTTKRKRDTK